MLLPSRLFKGEIKKIPHLRSVFAIALTLAKVNAIPAALIKATGERHILDKVLDRY